MTQSYVYKKTGLIRIHTEIILFIYKYIYIERDIDGYTKKSAILYTNQPLNPPPFKKKIGGMLGIKKKSSFYYCHAVGVPWWTTMNQSMAEMLGGEYRARRQRGARRAVEKISRVVALGWRFPFFGL